MSPKFGNLEDAVMQRLEESTGENTRKFLIVYDLHKKTSKNYQAIEDYLKDTLDAKKFLETTWRVQYLGDEKELLGAISHLFSANDKVGIVRFHKATRTVVGGNTKSF